MYKEIISSIKDNTHWKCNKAQNSFFDAIIKDIEKNMKENRKILNEFKEFVNSIFNVYKNLSVSLWKWEIQSREELLKECWFNKELQIDKDTFIIWQYLQLFPKKSFWNIWTNEVFNKEEIIKYELPEAIHMIDDTVWNKFWFWNIDMLQEEIGLGINKWFENISDTSSHINELGKKCETIIIDDLKVFPIQNRIFVSPNISFKEIPTNKEEIISDEEIIKLYTKFNILYKEEDFNESEFIYKKFVEINQWLIKKWFIEEWIDWTVKVIDYNNYFLYIRKEVRAISDYYRKKIEYFESNLIIDVLKNILNIK